jgi:hypothetical protein
LLIYKTGRQLCESKALDCRVQRLSEVTYWPVGDDLRPPPKLHHVDGYYRGVATDCLLMRTGKRVMFKLRCVYAPIVKGLRLPGHTTRKQHVDCDQTTAHRYLTVNLIKAVSR